MTIRPAIIPFPGFNLGRWLAATAALVLGAGAVFADTPMGAAAPAPSVAATDPAAPVPVAAVTPLADPDIDLRLGAFALSSVNTTLRLDAPNGSLGTSVNLADKLGANQTLSVFRADADWDISGPHGIEASWYDIALKGTKQIDTSIAWGNQVFPVNTTIITRFSTNVYKLAYSYTFHHDAKNEFTGLFGFHIMQFKASLGTSDLGQVQRFSVTAPLPSFGLAWRAHWTDRISTRVSMQYFGISLESGKYSGHLTDFLASAEYRFTKVFGLGAGYNRFDLTGAFKPNNLKLSVSYSYNGLLLYAFARF